MKKRESRLQIEVYDPTGSIRELWERVQRHAPGLIDQRMAEARKQFPELAFDENASSNGAILRHIMELFLKQHVDKK